MGHAVPSHSFDHPLLPGLGSQTQEVQLKGRTMSRPGGAVEGAVWAEARGLGWLWWAGQAMSTVGAQAHGAGRAVMR